MREDDEVSRREELLGYAGRKVWEVGTLLHLVSSDLYRSIN